MDGDVADSGIFTKDGNIAVRQADECTRDAVRAGIFGVDGDGLPLGKATSRVYFSREDGSGSFGNRERLTCRHFNPLTVADCGNAR